MDKITLTISYKNGGIISIPFPSLKKCDEFTMGYKDANELGETLNKILGLGLKEVKVYGVGIDYRYKSKGSNYVRTQYLDVKYNDDVYDYEELKNLYAEFFQDDRSRINNVKNGIWYVEHESVRQFIEGYKTISNDSIVKAVNSYLDGSYKKGRDAYFVLKKHGYIIKKKKANVEKPTVEKDLSTFKTKNAYYEHLKQYAKLGDEEYAKVMDILAGEDMDDLRHGMINPEYGVFDGAAQNSNYNQADDLLEDAMLLENLSEKSVEELMEIVGKYREKYYSGPKRR